MESTSDPQSHSRRPIALGRALTEDHVIWNFVRSELDSSRWNARLRPSLPPSLTTKVGSDGRASVTADEWAELRRALIAHRGRFVESLLLPGTRWRSVILDVSILPELRVISEKDFVRRAPSRLLGEFAAAADAGVSTIADFDFPYSRVRASFDPRRSQGIPILVAIEENGPYTIAEGLTRLTCLVSLAREGRLRIGSVDAVLGVNPAFATWSWL